MRLFVFGDQRPLISSDANHPLLGAGRRNAHLQMLPSTAEMSSLWERSIYKVPTVHF